MTRFGVNAKKQVTPKIYVVQWYFCLIGEFGYWLYSAAPQATSIDGLTAFLPQAMGMVIVAVIYGFMNMKAENPFRNKITSLRIISYSLHLVL